MAVTGLCSNLSFSCQELYLISVRLIRSYPIKFCVHVDRRRRRSRIRSFPPVSAVSSVSALCKAST
eukprot:2062007-Prymnesium_polylepis.2